MVIDEDGLHCVRTVKRLTEERRWDKSSLERVRWAPWHRYKDALDADGDLPEGVEAKERENLGSESVGKIFYVETSARPPRAFKITHDDIGKYKPTRGCKGCTSMLGRGLANQTHNDECRARFEELFKDTAKVKNAKARMEEFKLRQQDEEAKRERKKARKEAKRSGEGGASDEAQDGSGSRRSMPKADLESDKAGSEEKAKGGSVASHSQGS